MVFGIGHLTPALSPGGGEGEKRGADAKKPQLFEPPGRGGTSSRKGAKNAKVSEATRRAMRPSSGTVSSWMLKAAQI